MQINLSKHLSPCITEKERFNKLSDSLGISLGYMPVYSVQQNSEPVPLNSTTISSRFRMIKLWCGKFIYYLINRLTSFLSGPIGTGTRIVFQLAIAIVKAASMRMIKT